jgi:hypothetical protein
MAEVEGLRIGDAVGVDGGFAWIVTRLPFDDPLRSHGSQFFEVTTPNGHRDWVGRDRIIFVERTRQLEKWEV